MSCIDKHLFLYLLIVRREVVKADGSWSRGHGFVSQYHIKYWMDVNYYIIKKSKIKVANGANPKKYFFKSTNSSTPFFIIHPNTSKLMTDPYFSGWAPPANFMFLKVWNNYFLETFQFKLQFITCGTLSFKLSSSFGMKNKTFKTIIWLRLEQNNQLLQKSNFIFKTYNWSTYS